MYERTFELETFNGEKVKKKFYFQLNKAETIKWLTTNEGCTLDKLLEQLVRADRGRDIIDHFDKLIYLSCGEPSADGLRFIKTEEAKNRFMETDAYSQLFMELVSDAKAAGDFIAKILPGDITKDINQILKDNPDGIPDDVKEYLLGVDLDANS